jgi:hypothetical protein
MPAVRVPNVLARPSDRSPPAKTSLVLALVPSMRMATGPANGGQALAAGGDDDGLDEEVHLGAAHGHGAQVGLLAEQEAGERAGHEPDAAGVAAQVDDDAVGVPQLDHGAFELRRDGDHEDVEGDVADACVGVAGFVAGQPAVLEVGAQGGQVAELDELAGGAGTLDVEDDLPVVRVEEGHLDARADAPLEHRIDGLPGVHRRGVVAHGLVHAVDDARDVGVHGRG